MIIKSPVVLSTALWVNLEELTPWIVGMNEQVNEC